MTAQRVDIDQMFDSRATNFAFTARKTAGCITGFADGGWAPEPTMPD